MINYIFILIIPFFIFFIRKYIFINKPKIKLVIRLPNWIGDTLMTYPTLLALQKSGVNFLCIGHPWAKDIFSGTQIKIITNKQIKNYWWFYKTCYNLNPEYGLLFTKYLSTLLPMKAIGIKTIGNNYFSDIRVKTDFNNHTVEDYFDLGKPFIDKDLKLTELTDKIPISQQNKEIGEKIIDQEIKENQYIVICPYATNLHKGKNKEWPYWKQFCSEFKKYKIVALVSPNDYLKCLEDFPNIIVISTNLAASAYIMKQAKYVLANDSGAMHLASFFGANIIGLFGATEVNKTRPWYGKYLIGDNNDFISCYELISYIQ